MSFGLHYLHRALLGHVFISILNGIRPCGRGRKLRRGICIPALMFLFLLKYGLVWLFLCCILTFLVNAVFWELSWRLYQGYFCADAVRSGVEAWRCQILRTRLLLIGLFETEKCVIFTWLPLVLITASLLYHTFALTLRVWIQVHIDRAIIFINAGHWWRYDGILLHGL